VKEPRWLVGIERRVGFRGSVLLFLGELDLVYGWTLAFPSAASAVSPLNRYFCTMLPLRAWAVLWAGVGLICIYHAFHRYDRFGFIAAIAIKVLWGSLALIGVWYSDVSIASPAIWLSLAGLVWRVSGWAEPLSTIPRDGETGAS